MTPTTGVPITQRTNMRPLVAGLRVSHAEMEQLKAAASRNGQSVSDYLRDRVLNHPR